MLERSDTLTIETVELRVDGGDWAPRGERVTVADATHADQIGGWPEKGILDTELSPNRNGRKW